jgi:hypothetical protein
MSRAIQTAGLILVVVAITDPIAPSGRIAVAQGSSIGDPGQLMQTVLERMTREPPTYRGDNNIRLKRL